jgi:hypothetical protein
MPESLSSGKSYTLLRRIAAIRLVGAADDPHANCRELVQLLPGARLDCCGAGYNERTAKVRCAGEIYFVFLQDLNDSGVDRFSC